MSNKKLCAWITRHHPTKWQASNLREAGYVIHFLPTRERDATRILEMLNARLPRHPDLIVAAQPIPTLHSLAKLATCPVVIAEMDYSYQCPKWRGTWKRVIQAKLLTETFRPEEFA